jgi:hypothetical protein
MSKMIGPIRMAFVEHFLGSSPRRAFASPSLLGLTIGAVSIDLFRALHSAPREKGFCMISNTQSALVRKAILSKS